MDEDANKALFALMGFETGFFMAYDNAAGGSQFFYATQSVPYYRSVNWKVLGGRVSGKLWGKGGLTKVNR